MQKYLQNLLPFDRAQALLDKQKIIDKLNAQNEERTNLKLALQEVSMIAEEVPKDAMGDEISVDELDEKWDKIKAKVVKLNV